MAGGVGATVEDGMTGFIARWLSDAIRLGLSLTLALAAMQLPALAHAYTVALVQIVDSAHRDIEQRKDAARAYYQLHDAADEAVIAALRQAEPSNAEGLSNSIERARLLKAAYDRITRVPPLQQPIEAFLDAASDAGGDKRAVLQTAIETYVPQVAISAAAAIYGLIGLFLGAFAAHAFLALLGAVVRPRTRRREGTLAASSVANTSNLR
jgi:hypothetical protein